MRKLNYIDGNFYQEIGCGKMIANKQASFEYDIMRKNIKDYRKKLGYTQEQLAELSDLSVSYIKQIESKKEFKNVSLTTLLKLSKTLEISIHDLFENQ